MSDFIDTDDVDIFDPKTAAAAEDRAETQQQVARTAVEAHLRRSKQAYCAVFRDGTADAADVDFIMRDLAWFAKADVHYFENTRLQDVFAGRKQVLQRIAEYTGFDMATLIKRYAETQN